MPTDSRPASARGADWPGYRESELPTLDSDLDGKKSVTAPKDRASVTVLTGLGSGMLFALRDGELTCGRDARAGCRLADRAISPFHTRFFQQDANYWVEDLVSASGTFVRGRSIRAPVRVYDGDHVQLGPERVLRFNLYDVFEEQAAIELFEKSVRDATSGAYNREHLDSALDAELGLARESRAPLSLLLLDVDEFKRVNDDFGHVFGDAVLRVLTANVQRLLRPDDVLARYGGDELVVVCPNTTLRNALILAERIRASVDRLSLSERGNDLHITVSIGVATAANGDTSRGALFADADHAMYRVKQRGKNAVAGASSASTSGASERAGQR